MRTRSHVFAVLGLTLGLLAASRPPSRGRQAQPSVGQPPAVFVAIYERGPAWDAAKGTFEQARIQDHMAYLRANAEKLLAAAPFQQGIAPRSTDVTVGMVIVTAGSEEEAQRFVAGDPAIAAGVMKTTLRRWLVDRIKQH